MLGRADVPFSPIQPFAHVDAALSSMKTSQDMHTLVEFRSLGKIALARQLTPLTK